MIEVTFFFRSYEFLVTDDDGTIKIYCYTGQYSVPDYTEVKDPLPTLSEKAHAALEEYKGSKSERLADRHNDDLKSDDPKGAA